MATLKNLENVQEKSSLSEDDCVPEIAGCTGTTYRIPCIFILLFLAEIQGF